MPNRTMNEAEKSCKLKDIKGPTFKWKREKKKEKSGEEGGT